MINFETSNPSGALCLGAAVGTFFGGGKVGISSDHTPHSRMLTRAVLSGLLSSGSQPYIFGKQTLPAARCAARFYDLSCCIHLYWDSEMKTPATCVRLISGNGTDASAQTEQTISDITGGGEFSFMQPSAVKEGTYAESFRYEYMQALFDRMPKKTMRKNLEVQTSSLTVSNLLETVLSVIEQTMPGKAAPEFKAKIYPDGECFNLYTNSGKTVERELRFKLTIILLSHFCPGGTVVLPYDSPLSLKTLIIGSGGRIEYADQKKDKFMESIFEYGSEMQFRLFYDGIYFVIMLLAYLNDKNISFEKLLGMII